MVEAAGAAMVAAACATTSVVAFLLFLSSAMPGSGVPGRILDSKLAWSETDSRWPATRAAPRR